MLYSLFWGEFGPCSKTKRLMEDRCVDRRIVFSHLKCCFHILEDRIIKQPQCLWIIYREMKLRSSNQRTQLILRVFKDVIQYNKENKSFRSLQIEAGANSHRNSLLNWVHKIGFNMSKQSTMTYG